MYRGSIEVPTPALFLGALTTPLLIPKQSKTKPKQTRNHSTCSQQRLELPTSGSKATYQNSPLRHQPHPVTALAVSCGADLSPVPKVQAYAIPPHCNSVPPVAVSHRHSTEISQGLSDTGRSQQKDQGDGVIPNLSSTSMSPWSWSALIGRRTYHEAGRSYQVGLGCFILRWKMMVSDPRGIGYSAAPCHSPMVQGELPSCRIQSSAILNTSTALIISMQGADQKNLIKQSNALYFQMSIALASTSLVALTRFFFLPHCISAIDLAAGCLFCIYFCPCRHLRNRYSNSLIFLNCFSFNGVELLAKSQSLKVFPHCLIASDQPKA